MIEMELVGVRVELPRNQPIVLLREKDGTRYLPIWIGAVEATAIAFALQGVETPRPLTHDLFVAALEALEVTVEAVHVTELQDGTFFAELHLEQNGTRYQISARPSDALALLSRLDGVPVRCAPEVLDEAGLQINEDEDEVDVDPEEEVRQFRDFLDTVTPEDFLQE